MPALQDCIFRNLYGKLYLHLYLRDGIIPIPRTLRPVFGKGRGVAVLELTEKAAAGMAEQNYANKLMSKVAVWKENAIILLDPSTILYFSMVQKKVIVHTGDDTYESSASLDHLEQRLSARGFFRSHKSFIVNMDHVDRIVPWFNSTYMIKLKAETEQIPVSRYYSKRMRSLLNI